MASNRKIKRQTIDGETVEYLTPKEQAAEDRRQQVGNGPVDLSRMLGATRIITPDRRENQ